MESATPDRPKFVYEPDPAAGSFILLIAQENQPTVDGRMFAEGAVSWRELPIPLTLNRANTAVGQHKESRAVGMISEIWRDENDIFGRGFFSSDEEGQTARALIKEGTISGVSADVGGVISEELTADSDFPEGVRKIIRSGTIIGVTALLHASFDDTKIAVDETPITAAAGQPWSPPAEVFGNPQLKQPTPFTITADGRVFGHAALWNTCHVGYRDRCVTPPHSKSNYAYFNTGTVLTAASNPVHVGRITADTGHAPLEFAADPAVAHYDNTGYAAAFVAAGEDAHGIWFSGMIAPTATEAQVANLRAAGVSGDWRNINGSLEMVGLLAVNTPGFPVPRPSAAMTAGATTAIVAAGAFVPVSEAEVEEFAKKESCCKECAEKAEEEDESVTLMAEDVQENALFREGDAIEWSTDHDSTFLALLGEKITEVLSVASRARENDTPLNPQVQSFAAWVTQELSAAAEQITRSISGVTAPVETAPTRAALSIEQRIALLDMDLEVLGVEI